MSPPDAQAGSARGGRPTPEGPPDLLHDGLDTREGSTFSYPPMDDLDISSSEPIRMLRSPQGTTQIWTPAKGLLFARIKGPMDIRGAHAISDEIEQLLRAVPKGLFYYDFEEMTGYDDASRAHLLHFARRVLPGVEGIHVLVRSRVVAFGIRTANVVLKIVQVYTDRTPFEAALRAALRDKRRGPG